MNAAVRIGNCSGFYGDRLSAMQEMLTDGDLDYLTGDYLAELTMLILGRDQRGDPALGYARTFLRQLGECLVLAVDRGVRIVSNAGGLNPAGLADRVRELATEQGLTVAVAHVEGDDLRPRAAELGLTGPGGAPPLTANAYPGAFGIAEALGAGADVVITGRVTDASLAGAVAAEHVIECGAQVTGGNFSGFCWASQAGADLRRPGFPIAEVAADGDSVITKHPGTGGLVTVDTVTAQLVYEVGAPAYLGPDMTCHLDALSLEQVGTARVAVTGARGTRPPPTTKVCLNSVGGFRNSVELLLTGLEVEAKADLVRSQVEAALAADPPDAIEWQLDARTVDDPATQAEATSVLRCHVRSSRPDPVGRAFSGAVVELALASYPGFTLTRPPAAGTPFGVYTAAYVPNEAVDHVVVLPDGTRTVVEWPPVNDDPANPSRSVTLSLRVPDDGPTTRVTLGTVADARSGDKGGDANVGVWVGDYEAYGWLLATLTPERVAELLPEAAELPIEVHPLPNLRAVNIVIHGLLGESVAASTRTDPQAKALGEWLRARHVDVPITLLRTLGADITVASSDPSAIGHETYDVREPT